MHAKEAEKVLTLATAAPEEKPTMIVVLEILTNQKYAGVGQISFKLKKKKNFFLFLTPLM